MSILDELASELGISPDSLRSSILAGDETLSPTYITINPDGTVTATFPGGVILPEGIQGEVIHTGAPGAAVQWTDPSTGALVAQESVVHKGLPLPSQPSDIYSILLQPGIEQNVGPISSISLEVLAAVAGVAKAQILLDAWDSSGAGVTRTILNSDGKSDFLREAGYLEDDNSYNTTSTVFVPSTPMSVAIASAGTYIVIFGGQIIGLGALSPSGAGFAPSDVASATVATAGANQMCYAFFVSQLNVGTITLYMRSINGANTTFTRMRLVALGPF